MQAIIPPVRLTSRIPARPQLLYRPHLHVRKPAYTKPSQTKTRTKSTAPSHNNAQPHQNSSSRSGQSSWFFQFASKTVRYTAYTLPVALSVSPYLPYTTVAVNGQSMMPLLSPSAHSNGNIGQDILLVKPASHLNLYPDPAQEGGTGRGVEGLTRHGKNVGIRGAIVVFRTPHAPEREGVKRIVAIEGDSVVVRHDFRHRWRPAIESKQFSGEIIPVLRPTGSTPTGCPYPQQNQSKSSEDFDVKLTIPYGHVWVEGENPSQSRDSNDYGPISKALIQGLAVGIISPRSRWNLDVAWEEDGWRERWRGRGFRWLDEIGKPEMWQLDVPEAWQMYQ